MGLPSAAFRAEVAMRFLQTILLLLGITIVCLSCSSEDENPVEPERRSTNLEGQNDVIPNLLLAIERRDLGQMERLLASDIIFDFSQEALDWGIVSTRS